MAWKGQFVVKRHRARSFGNRWAVVFTSLVATALCGWPVQAVEIVFDYSHDALGFFDDPVRREVLELAGSIVNRFVDQLEAIEPEGDNSWSIFPALPPGGANNFLVDEIVAAHTLNLIVGGNNILPGGTLAHTTIYESIFLSGTPQWEDTISFRGQVGASQTPPTDFGPWGGVSMFNADESEVPWHFGLTTEGLDPQETDFLTVATHELMHIFGFGPAESFQAYYEGPEDARRYSGPEAAAVGSVTNIDLDLHDGGHWAIGTSSSVGNILQEVLMGPIVQPGVRRVPTALDRAVLRDVGWEEALPGDANLDRQFGPLDIVLVSQQAKYLTGQPVGWSGGDWNDDFVFDQLDLMAALATGTYLTGFSAAITAGGMVDDGRTSVVYDAASGEVSVEVAWGVELTSINIDSAAGILTGDAAANLGGSFDNDSDTNIFRATFGSSFGSFSFGNVAVPGLEQTFLLQDLTVAGSRAGGGELIDVDLIYKPIPEPSTSLLLCLGVLGILALSSWNPRRPCVIGATKVVTGKQVSAHIA